MFAGPLPVTRPETRPRSSPAVELVRAGRSDAGLAVLRGGEQRLQPDNLHAGNTPATRWSSPVQRGGDGDPRARRDEQCRARRPESPGLERDRERRRVRAGEPVRK